ncbi:MAG: hypothetical protein ABW168_02085 [Sedimenticola sp.]
MGHHATTNTRRHIAEEAARILAEQSHLSTDEARMRAAKRIGCTDGCQFPDNLEIEAALKAYRLVFHHGHADTLLRLREMARSAMKSLIMFYPQLIGPVLNGTADRHSCISLLLFAETTEDVILRLLELKIPWQEMARRLRYGNGDSQQRPLLSFIADSTEIELLVLTATERRNPPIDPVAGGPLKGADLTHLDQLIRGGNSVDG